MESYFPEWMVIVGVLFMTAEALLFRFSTIVLFCTGLALVITGALMFISVLPINLLYGFISSVFFTIVLSLSFWNPLKLMRMRAKTATIDTQFHDKEFILDADVNIVSDFEYRFCGITWKVRSVEPLLKGTLVKIERMEDGVLWVSAIKKQSE